MLAEPPGYSKLPPAHDCHGAQATPVVLAHEEQQLTAASPAMERLAFWAGEKGEVGIPRMALMQEGERRTDWVENGRVGGGVGFTLRLQVMKVPTCAARYASERTPTGCRCVHKTITVKCKCVRCLFFLCVLLQFWRFHNARAQTNVRSLNHCYSSGSISC